MGFGLGSLLSGVSGILGDEPEQSESKQGFAAMPKELQDAWLKTVLPAIMAQHQKPYQSMPMARAQAPTTPFDSQEIYKLQQLSDSRGGLFSPLKTTGQNISAPTPAANPSTITSSDMGKLVLQQLIQGAASPKQAQAMKSMVNSPEREAAVADWFREGSKPMGGMGQSDNIYLLLKQRGLI